MAAMEHRPGRPGGRAGASTIISGLAAAALGLVSGPALAQAGATLVGGAAPEDLQSLSMGTLAVVLSLWLVREAYARRLEEAQRYAGDLQRLSDLRLEEEREHAATITRIYETRRQDSERLLAAYERIHQEDVALQGDLLRRLLDSKEAAE